MSLKYFYIELMYPRIKGHPHVAFEHSCLEYELDKLIGSEFTMEKVVNISARYISKEKHSSETIDNIWVYIRDNYPKLCSRGMFIVDTIK